MGFILRFLGHKAAHRVVQPYTRDGGFLDIKHGFRMFRDPRVSVLAKLASLATGVTLTLVLVAMEAPLALLLALFIPFVGLELDMVIDGLEILIFPMLFACILLPRFVKMSERRLALQAIPIRRD